MKARRTKVLINGVEARLKSFKFTDNLDKADTCEIVLADNEHVFIRGAIPAKSSSLRIALAQENILNCGSFELDRISYKSPPSELTLHLNSVPSGAGLRGSIKNRAWEQTNLQKIARDIASDAGLSLYYDAGEVQIQRAEQNSSGLSFLEQLCKSNGLKLKVSGGKIVIFEAVKYEQKSAVAVISYGDKNILSYNFDGNATGIFGSANIDFKSNGIAEWLSFFGISDIIRARFGSGSGSVLQINERVDSLSEAERLSKARLRENNQDEWKANFTLAGSFEYAAGLTVNLSGYSVFSGKYLISSANHTVDGSGYKTVVQLQKCLGY